ncbi:teicoplanin resistance protein VanZ [Sulfitobacter sp. JBTF-M27]|uniref:Teicoplanin resistance protein VanZ n=1 Tax=Sulfitobacter sediminilitoris TaxID=2698830 RepID=A0A6P0CG74_9RHOB|nr:teicoplanin resistance protein VanZ [Sulfitobacter sediminilitoris]NEK25139.1 teicoplanin resistance protein VanZ [Sulfitobacter sediminilitoris]
MTNPERMRAMWQDNAALRHSVALLATGLLAAIIAWLTLSPPKQHVDGILSDKAYHAIAFAALALPCAVLYARALTWTMPIAALFGAAIELIQPIVGRSAETADFVADLVGLAIGVALGLFLRAKIQSFVSR